MTPALAPRLGLLGSPPDPVGRFPMREGPSGRDCSGWARRADCPPAFMLSPGRLRPGPGFALHSIAATPIQTGANAIFRALNPLLFLMPCVFSSPRLAPHIPESQVDCGGHSEICGPAFRQPIALFRKRSAGQKGKARGRKPIANSHSRWPRFKHETVCRCRALSLPGRLPLARSAKALWRLSRDSPSAHHPEAAGQCSSCSVCSRRSTSGRAMA